jgi:hypothetical protein
MKFLPLYIFIVVALASGCSETNQPSEKDVYVAFDVEYDFQNDLVTILLDDKTLLESRITTNHVLSLAWSSGLKKLSRDPHSLYFGLLEYGAHNAYNIDLTNDTSTVTIRFNRSTSQIQFQQYKGRLLRD